MIRAVCVLGLVACGGSARPSDADCDRATARAGVLMDSGFPEQQAKIASELAKLCRDPRQGWTKRQTDCLIAATTAAAYKQCTE